MCPCEPRESTCQPLSVKRSNSVTGLAIVIRSEIMDLRRCRPLRLTHLLPSNGEQICHLQAEESKSVTCCRTRPDCDYPGKIGVSRGMRLRRVFLPIRWNHSDSSVQSEDRYLSRHVIDVACAVRTSSRWRRFSMDQSQISKMLASPRIVDDRARSGGLSGVERLTARKPGSRIAQRSVPMDCQIRNHHVRSIANTFS